MAARVKWTRPRALTERWPLGASTFCTVPKAAPACGRGLIYDVGRTVLCCSRKEPEPAPLPLRAGRDREADDLSLRGPLRLAVVTRRRPSSAGSTGALSGFLMGRSSRLTETGPFLSHVSAYIPGWGRSRRHGAADATCPADEEQHLDSSLMTGRRTKYATRGADDGREGEEGETR
ncbi:hypothetical protein SKAU_G00361890 [Synaphobranchus kaupii]|uniref:Uncharacterized protein n=1 Tax=Synaphobranchus kaupii TaxID=118154 RepID=A0A9Q1IF18_SYNKA|nr:hypothetical protein SKAU_G00361890 [Synaphobranchus kaupii]